ncbi:MFS transporter prlG [Fusarium oxysporum f. sp. cubense]|uniref:MFS transporter prlG n=1 Tax=Fusarium oxysporum f. sp. cubense TaxID=61366 RepID=A0A559KZA8_FUSOC|nr:MFS transporter prlG [Fusarium oxysporum f. sp. cubense]
MTAGPRMSSNPEHEISQVVDHVDENGGWDGPDDPDNPANWPRHKRNWNIVLVALVQLLSNLGSTMFAPGAAKLMKDFDSTSHTVTSLSVSIYVLGYALGPLLFAPLSEVFGRLPIYIVTNVMFLAFVLACGFATNLSMFIVFRFINGAVGSASQALSGGTLADLVPREERGKWMGLIVLGPIMGPTIGPIAGGFVSQYIGWRWVFYTLAITWGVILVPALIFMRETYSPVILRRKFGRKDEGSAFQGEPILTRLRKSIGMPLKLLFFSPIVFFLSLYVAFSFGLMYLLFTTFSTVFRDQYGFSVGISGLSYIGLGVGMVGGVIVQGRLSDRIMKSREAARGGERRPEDRLVMMAYMAPSLPIGLFWYGWATEKQVHWIVPILGTVFVGVGFICILMSVMMYLVDAFDVKYTASALAANTLLRSLGGAFLPLAGPKMYSKLGLGWGNSLLGFLAVAFIPLPWIFLYYGKQIRLSGRKFR